MTRDGLLHRYDRLDWPRILVAALALTIAIAIVSLAATTTTAFAPFNPSWDGTTDLRDQIEADSSVDSEIVRETTRYDEVQAESSVAFVVAPDESYDGADADRVRRFVHGGGTLVVFENFGENGNDLGADAGAGARVDGQVLRDEQHHYRSPTMPIATDVENHSYTTAVDQVTLNYASVVEPNGATVLVSSSEYGYLVDDPDTELDDDTDLGVHPVATVEDVGDGQVVVVADPSLVVNSMLAEPDNAAFVANLYADEDRVLFDQSHAGDIPPLRAAVLDIRESAVGQALLGLTAIGIVAVLSQWSVRPTLEWARDRLPGVRRRDDGAARDGASPGLSRAEQVEFLRRKHPDWDEERIDRVLANAAASTEQEETE